MIRLLIKIFFSQLLEISLQNEKGVQLKSYLVSVQFWRI